MQILLLFVLEKSRLRFFEEISIFAQFIFFTSTSRVDHAVQDPAPEATYRRTGLELLKRYNFFLFGSAYPKLSHLAWINEPDSAGLEPEIFNMRRRRV